MYLLVSFVSLVETVHGDEVHNQNTAVELLHTVKVISSVHMFGDIYFRNTVLKEHYLRIAPHNNLKDAVKGFG